MCLRIRRKAHYLVQAALPVRVRHGFINILLNRNRGAPHLVLPDVFAQGENTAALALRSAGSSA